MHRNYTGKSKFIECREDALLFSGVGPPVGAVEAYLKVRRNDGMLEEDKWRIAIAGLNAMQDTFHQICREMHEKRILDEGA